MREWLNRLGTDDWPPILVEWSLRLAGAVVIVLVGLWLVRRIAHLTKRGLNRADADPMLRQFLINLARGALTVLVVAAALDHLGVPTTSLIALLGAAGLAVGLALRDSLANIASGVMLIALRPFRAGDAVRIADQEGVAEQIGIFQTVLRTYDNHEISLPNRQITAAPIVNFTAREHRRIDIPIGVGYETDVAHARETLLDMARGHDKVLADPPCQVLATGLGDNSVNLVLRAWVRTPDFAVARSELIEAVHRELGKAGIGIPYPQREVHLKLPPGTVLRVPVPLAPGE